MIYYSKTILILTTCYITKLTILEREKHRFKTWLYELILIHCIIIEYKIFKINSSICSMLDYITISINNWNNK
jgi:hypothetical protein